MLKCKIEVFAHRCMSTTNVAPFWKESLNYIQLSDHIQKIREKTLNLALLNENDVKILSKS